MAFGIRIRPADKKFSNYIRTLHNWTCEVCGRRGKINGQTVYKMEASHYFSRKKESTRFDPLNVRCLCFSCHQRMGSNHTNEQGEYDLWMKEKLGEQEYRKLCLRANTPGKKDDKLTLLYIDTLMKEL